MGSRTIYNCDICDMKNITDGVSMAFEVDPTAEGSVVKYKLVKTVQGLHVLESPKVSHVCAICSKSIINAKEVKK